MINIRAALAAILLLFQLLHPALSLYIDPEQYKHVRSVKIRGQESASKDHTLTESHVDVHKSNLAKRGDSIDIYIGNLAKRGGSIDMFIGKTAKASAGAAIQIAKKNPYTALGISGVAAVRGAYSLYDFIQKHSVDKDDRRRRGKRHLKRYKSVAKDDGEGDLHLKKRATGAKPTTLTQKGKAFIKTKKGKLLIGGMVVKGAATVGFLYYLRHKKQKQAELQRFTLTHRPVFLQADPGPDSKSFSLSMNNKSQ